MQIATHPIFNPAGQSSSLPKTRKTPQPDFRGAIKIPANAKRRFMLWDAITPPLNQAIDRRIFISGSTLFSQVAGGRDDIDIFGRSNLAYAYCPTSGELFIFFPVQGFIGNNRLTIIQAEETYRGGNADFFEAKQNGGYCRLQTTSRPVDDLYALNDEPTEKGCDFFKVSQKRV